MAPVVTSCSSLSRRHLAGFVTVLALPFDTTKTMTESSAPEASHSSTRNTLAGLLTFQVGKDLKSSSGPAPLLSGDEADKISQVKSVCNLIRVHGGTLMELKNGLGGRALCSFVTIPQPRST